MERIPGEFRGIIDLRVCHSIRLVESIKAARRCVVLYSRSTATPVDWLYFYLVLFKLLRSETMDYFQAVETTIAALAGKKTR